MYISIVATALDSFLGVRKKGSRKPRLTEPMLATLKQNMHQSPIRIIRPSPTPISPSYKAKASTKVSLKDGSPKERCFTNLCFYSYSSPIRGGSRPRGLTCPPNLRPRPPLPPSLLWPLHLPPKHLPNLNKSPQQASICPQGAVCQKV